MKTVTVPYVALSCLSSFSLNRGCLSPEEICSRAGAEGWRAAALTDVENFYGLVRFILAARSEGIKPIAGVTFSCGSSVLIAWCMNRKGYARLCSLLTARFHSRPLSPGVRDEGRDTGSGGNVVDEFLENGWDGLCLATDSVEVLSRLAAKEKRGVYGALVYGKPFRTMAVRARELDVPLLPVNTALYTDERQREFCALRRALGEGRTLRSLREHEKPGRELRMASSEEMRRYFSSHPEAFHHALQLAEGAETEGILHERFVFPRFRDLSDAEAFRKLRSLCHEGVFRRYGEFRADIGDRIDYELGIIRDKGFAAYFLVVHDIVCRCPRTCGRGSSASSIVSYLLGITHVDPIRYNLFFERFLNRGRRDPPDIDVDFPWDEREKALSYVFETYAGRSGMVADHVTYADRSCIREPAKAFGYGDREIDRLVKLWSRGELSSIPDCLTDAAAMIRGLPWYIGTHPGGVVITPGPITEYVHVQPSPSGIPVIAWEKDAAESAGLVKIDLLGNRSLGVLRDTLELVNTKREEPLTWEGFQPLEDPGTRAFIETGDTLGIFYIESPATRLLLRKMGSGDYPHLVVATSIIRPAANGCITEYLARLKGKPWDFFHPRVRETLAETLGIMVYQEDVSRIALAAAGFSHEEADYLRKVLSKKAGSGILETYHDRFFAGARANGVPEAEIEELWQMILSFRGYSFCKAHSASYALVSYRLAYLKRVYPLEFMISVINNGGGFYGAQVYLNAVRRMGFRVLPPDVNASAVRYTVEGTAVRVGLVQVRDVSSDFLQRLVGEREEKGPYRDFRDFLLRTAPDLGNLRMLIRSGALDSLAGGMNRPQMFWFYHHFSLRRAVSSGELFEALDPPRGLPDYPPPVKLRDEVTSTGLIFSRFPLEVFRPRIAQILRTPGWPPVIESRMLAERVDSRISIAGTFVAGKEVETKHAKSMCFVSFEDADSVFETVLFPEAWELLREVLCEGSAFLVRGLVTSEYGAVVIQVEHIAPLSRHSINRPSRIYGTAGD